MRVLSGYCAANVGAQRELGFAEIVPGDTPPDRTGQVWIHNGEVELVVGPPRAFDDGGKIYHPIVILSGSRTRIRALAEHSLLGCRREL